MSRIYHLTVPNFKIWLKEWYDKPNKPQWLLRTELALLQMDSFKEKEWKIPVLNIGD